MDNVYNLTGEIRFRWHFQKAVAPMLYHEAFDHSLKSDMEKAKLIDHALHLILPLYAREKEMLQPQVKMIVCASLNKAFELVIEGCRANISPVRLGQQWKEGMDAMRDRLIEMSERPLAQAQEAINPAKDPVHACIPSYH